MKIKMIFATLTILFCGQGVAKVTYDDAVTSSSGFYDTNNAINNGPNIGGLSPEEQSDVNSGDWELRVFTVVTSGGCCGTEARTYYGKFDKTSGKFLGYINNQTAYSTSDKPNWR